jgi:hypothetical protein
MAALRGQLAHIFDVTRPPWTGGALTQYVSQQFTLVPATTATLHCARRTAVSS